MKLFERDELLDSLRALLRNAAASLLRLLARHASRQIIARRVATFAL
jgi:hypothetical protein